jgi:hypothetical protein
MREIIYGLAALPLIAGFALAEPANQSKDSKTKDSKTSARIMMQLTDSQLDKVNAGTFVLEVDNTGLTAVSLWFRPYLTDPTPNFISCNDCYLVISTPTFSLASLIGQSSTLPIAPR